MYDPAQYPWVAFMQFYVQISLTSGKKNYMIGIDRVV